MPLRTARLTAVAAAVLASTATLLLADGHDPVKAREDAMGIVGKSTKTIGDMLKGETTFDAAAANAALVAMQEAVVDWETLFPDGTAGAGSNEFVAAEAIFTDRDGFNAAVAKFQTDIAAAVDAGADTPETMQPVFGAVAQNCRSCHEDYRLKK